MSVPPVHRLGRHRNCIDRRHLFIVRNRFHQERLNSPFQPLPDVPLQGPIWSLNLSWHAIRRGEHQDLPQVCNRADSESPRHVNPASPEADDMPLFYMFHHVPIHRISGKPEPPLVVNFHHFVRVSLSPSWKLFSYSWMNSMFFFHCVGLQRAVLVLIPALRVHGPSMGSGPP